MDFAGLARLFTPQNGKSKNHESWYLFAAWILAATMNAVLTWWGVTIALLNHETLGNQLVSRQSMLSVAPLFVALMVWLIRVMIIGTFSAAGEKIFSQTETGARPQVVQSERVANGNTRPMNMAVPIMANKERRANNGYKPFTDVEHKNANNIEPDYERVNGR